MNLSLKQYQQITRSQARYNVADELAYCCASLVLEVLELKNAETASEVESEMGDILWNAVRILDHFNHIPSLPNYAPSYGTIHEHDLLVNARIVLDDWTKSIRRRGGMGSWKARNYMPVGDSAMLVSAVNRCIYALHFLALERNKTLIQIAESNLEKLGFIASESA